VADSPVPFNPKTLEEAIRMMQFMQEDLYQEKIAGAQIGDVFSIDNETDILTLDLSNTPGLDKNGGLHVLANPAGPVTVGTDGLDVSLASTTKKGAAPILPNDATKYLDGVGAWAAPAAAMWPIGAVFLSVVSTDPATLLGFGTWSQIAQGQMLVGFKTGDADFGTVEGTGGAKTSTHTNNHSGGSATISDQPTAHGTTTINDPGSGGSVKTVLTDTNNHSGTAVTHADPSAHGDHNILNPFFTIYVWKRTA
jgi:hypothetical protein